MPRIKPNKAVNGVKGEPIRDHNGDVVGGKKGRSGPPLNNVNALRNGTGDHNKLRLTVGELPTKMITVRREAMKYRRQLEAEVIAIKGDIDLLDAHLINTASAATIQAGICRWLLRNRVEDMNVNDIRGCSADIVKAKGLRDKAVQQLQLNQQPQAPWVVDEGPFQGIDVTAIRPFDDD